MEIEQTYTQTTTVKAENTAKALGSGNLEVYGTPALSALMENTAVKTIEKDLEKGSDTVGISIHLEHVKASAVGERISCTATINKIEGRKISFGIEAKDGKGDVIGTATHDRFVIDVERFMGKLKK